MLRSLQALNVVLLIACVISFTWGMRRVFVRPNGVTLGMRLVRGLGALALLHIGALVFVTPTLAFHLAGGAALYVCSLTLFWWCVGATAGIKLSAVFSDDLPQCIVSTGPYRLIRHPFYSAYLLAWFAGAVATRNIFVAMSVVLMLVVYRLAAAHEERKFSLSPMKKQYDEYRRVTGSFAPRFSHGL